MAAGPATEVILLFRTLEIRAKTHELPEEPNSFSEKIILLYFMTIQEKKELLKAVYEDFSKEVLKYREKAVCGPSCSFCCSHMGDIDITTLEGLIIREKIESLPRTEGKTLLETVHDNRVGKERRERLPCPFLRDNLCLIYEVRPFSCRQLYSLEKCGPAGSVIHRRAVEIARTTVRRIQRIDETGYSGHISYILELLGERGFRKSYLSGEFNPSSVAAFGKAHGLIINRFVK